MHPMRRTFGAGQDLCGALRDVREMRDTREIREADGPLIPPPTPAIYRPQGTTQPNGPRSTLGVHTLQNYGKSSENQDAFVASSSLSGSKSLVGVFDGHGEQGKRMSEFAKNQIARVLFGHKDLHSNPAAALEGAYHETQRQIERNHHMEALHSGTTAVAAYRHRDRLFIANVGDSRAVLGCADSANGEGLRAVELSSDQRPAREDERRRILAEGGSVHQSAIPVRQSFGAPPVLVRVGPERVWDRTGRCGLCVTRSLGDLSMRPFVTAQPEVSERVLCNKDKVLILGSDGVWDRLGSQEAVDIAAKHRDPGAAAREIASVARQRWHAETQGQLSDDITAVVMHLDHDTPPSTASGRGISTPASQHRVQSGEGFRKVVAESPAKRLGASQRLAALESLRGSTGERVGMVTMGQRRR